MNMYQAIMGYLDHKAYDHYNEGWEPTEESKAEFEERLQKYGFDPQKTDIQAAFYKIVALGYEKAAKWVKDMQVLNCAERPSAQKGSSES